MKITLFLLLLLFTGCQKEIINSEISLQGIEIITNGEEVIFSPNVLPGRKFVDSTDHYLMGDSVYFPVDATFNITFTVTNSGGHTCSTLLIIDGVVVDSVLTPVVSMFGQLKFIYEDNYGVQEGWHLLKFKGRSWAPDSTNAYYKINIGEFTANDLQGNPLSITGLPIEKMRWFQTE